MTTTDSPSALSAVEAKLFVPADDSQWEAFAGRYRALLDAPLDAAGVPDWLTGWNAVGSAVTDVAARLFVSGTERRIEFNPRGPLPLQEAVQTALVRCPA